MQHKSASHCEPIHIYKFCYKMMSQSFITGDIKR